MSDLLNYALSVGINEVDTSPLYKSAEKMIGKYQKINPSLKINTKIALPRSQEGKISPTEIKKQVELSLSKLNVERIDTLFFHSIPFKFLSLNTIQSAINLKLSNQIFKLGYSGDNEELQKAIDTDTFDSFMITANALDVTDYHRINQLKTKNIFIKRPLANAVFKKTLNMAMKSSLKRLVRNKKDMFPNSYPSRYRRIYGEPRLFNNDIIKFIQFLVYIQPKAKYVFGVSSMSHLKEIVNTYNLVISEAIPELYEHLVKVTELSEKYQWRALS